MIGYIKLRVPEAFPPKKFPKLHALSLHCETREEFVKSRISADESCQRENNVDAKTIVDFWTLAGPERWFTKDAAFDGALSVRFGNALRQARLGAFDHWGETPEGALGLSFCLIRFRAILIGAAHLRLPEMPRH